MASSGRAGVEDVPLHAGWQALLEAHEVELARRVRWLLFWRLVVASVCLTILLLLEGGIIRVYPAAYAIVVLIFPLTLAYLGLYKRTSDLESFVVFQVVVDVLIETALVYSTGGVHRVGFAFLYFLSILSASLLISDRAGLVLASIATVMNAVVAVTYLMANSYAFVPPLLSKRLVEGADAPWNFVVANLIGTGVGFHLVAALASLLPYRVTRARLLYDEILDSMREGLVAVDSVGRIVFVNREARRILNWEGIGRMVGRRYPDVLRRREDRRVLELLMRETDAHEELEIDIRGRGPVAVEIKTAVLRDTDGALRGVIGMFADATLRRRLAEMETRLARIEGTHEMAMGIAHELRNPLASIRGAVQELVRAGDPRFSEDDRKLADVVRRESDRLDKLIEEFLAFARVRPPERRPVDLARVVEETALLLSARDDAKSVAVESDIDAHGGPFIVLADAEQLRQVFLNIGINALQALKGNGRIDIVLRSAWLPSHAPTPEGGRLLASRSGVEVAFDDDGPGVPLDVRAKVFTPFFSTKKEGLGLGLSIAQKIVRDHEGDIACESAPSGKGARFRLTLPLAPRPGERVRETPPRPFSSAAVAARASPGGTP